jgi:hypothetical protein
MICKKCNVDKPFTKEYFREFDNGDGKRLRKTCKECYDKQAKIWLENNKERSKKIREIWEEKNRTHVKEKHKQWVANNKDHVKETIKNWYKNNKEHCREYIKNWEEKNKEQVVQRCKIRYDKQKNIVFDHYGRKCSCPGCNEDHFEFLTIDHINGGGHKHRKTLTINFYHWLIKNNFPLEYRTLCMNCNFSLGRLGYCPHGIEKKKEV